MIDFDQIKEIAQPILDAILDMEEELPADFFSCLNQIQLVIEDADEKHPAQDIDPAFIQCLEHYITEELQKYGQPTILH